MTPFTFVLDWYINCQFAGLIWAKEKGLYKQAGLDVQLVDPHDYPKTPTLEVVKQHAFSAGCMEDNLVVRAVLADKGVKAIGAMLQQTPMVLMTATDGAIQTLHDLPGRRIAMHRDGIHLLKTVLTLHGIDQSEIEFTVGGWSLPDLINGRFDAVQGYTITEPAQLLGLGFDSHLIPVKHPNLHPYAQMMFATSKMIEQNQNILSRFISATFDGWREAMTHQDETAVLVAAVSKDQPDAKMNRQILDAMLPIVKGEVGFEKLGFLDPARWQRNLKTYYDFGMVDRYATFDEVVYPKFVN